MPQFKNMNQLQKQLEFVTQKSLDAVTDVVFDELYNFIDEKIYKLGVLKIEPSLGDFGYEQTGQFIDALKRTKVINTGSSFKTIIYFDYKEMSPMKTDRFYNAHMGLSGETSWLGSSISSWMPIWLDLGIDSPTFMHNGIRFTEFIERYINQNFDRLIKAELKKYGLIMR